MMVVFASIIFIGTEEVSNRCKLNQILKQNIIHSKRSTTRKMWNGPKIGSYII